MEAESEHADSLPSQEQKDKADLLPFCWVEFGQNGPVPSLMPDLEKG